MEIEMNNVIQWINETIINDGTNRIEVDDIGEIRDFALLWNLFESLCFDKFVDMNKINRLIDTKIDLFDEAKYQDIFDYFYNRYKNDNPKVEALHLRNGDKELVKKVLNDNFTDKNNKLKFIMAIIYRYRNNLFHGEKDMRYIRLQKENFQNTNKFLMYFIETCKEN